MAAWVAFIGGPYDGCEEQLEEFESEIEIPVSANVLRLLSGDSPGKESRIRSVAMYELAVFHGGIYYVYRGSRKAAKSEADGLKQWNREVLAWCMG